MLYGVDLCTSTGGPEQPRAVETLTISGSPLDGVVRIALEFDSVALVSYQQVGEITTEPRHQDPWTDLEDITSVVFELEPVSHGPEGDAMAVYVRVSNFTGLVEADGIVWAHFIVDEWTLARVRMPDRGGG